MIKLKQLILENDNDDLVISKMEEQYALRAIIVKLIPKAVFNYNKFIHTKKVSNRKKKFNYTTPEEMRRNIKKILHELKRIEYDCILKHGHVQFAIIKEINPITEKKSVVIGFLGAVDLGWTNASGYIWYDLNSLINF